MRLFLLKNVNSSPIGASGGVWRQRVSPVAVFLLKHFPVPTNHEGLFSCPPNWAWPMTFPPTSGISPTEELLRETHCFLTSRHLSLLLTYIHPAIHCFGTSVAPSIHEKNQNVDQKLIFFSQKLIFFFPKNYMLPMVSFWSPSVGSRWAYGIINHGTVLGKQVPWGHLMGSSAGKFLGFHWVFSSFIFDFYFFFNRLSLETIAKECNSTPCIFEGARPPATSPRISQISSLPFHKSICLGFNIF